MDPASLLLTLLMKNPDFAASAAQSAVAPGAVDVTKMQGSLVDLSKGILTCYHKTARFRQTDIIKTPWDRQGQYGAERSAVIKITFSGITTAQYEMLVAVMIRGNSVRSAVIAESSIIPYNKKCALEDWTAPV
jgi:hypothetical protein